MSTEPRLDGLLSSARWRRGSIVAVLLALPLSALLIVASSMAQALPWIVAALVVSSAGLALGVRWIRQLDRRWLANQLDRYCPELQDSSALLLDLEPVASPLAELQQQRMAARVAALALPELRQPWPWVPVGVLGLLCAAVVMAVAYRPEPVPALASSSAPVTQQPEAPTQTELRSQQLRVEPPAYTGLAATEGPDLEQRVPEGALLQWALRFEPDPGAVSLRFHDRSVLDLSKDDAGFWRGEKRLAQATFYRIELSDSPPLSEDRSWRLELIRDRPPQIKVIEPERNLTVLERQQPRWPLRFEVSDDYGLGAAQLSVTLAQGSGELVEVTERTVQLRGEGDARNRRYTQSLQLGAYGFARGDDLIVRLSVSDNRQPAAQTTRSPSFILRWPAELSAEVGEIDGVVQRVMPTWFRSQRQIIIDTENLLERRGQLSAEEFGSESNDIGISQHSLRLRYGQFLGEESEQAEAEGGEGEAHHPGDGHDHGEAHHAGDGHDHDESHHAGDGHDHGPEDGAAAVFGRASNILEEYGHTHDYAEATTLFDPRTRRLLKAALDQMWRAEEQLRTAQPQAALPFEYAALEYIKQAQQASRIYLARVGLELPPIDFSRRLSGDTKDLARPRDALQPAQRERPLLDLWSALAPARLGEQGLDLDAIAAAEAWLIAQDESFTAGLDLLAATDQLRRDPDCAPCAQRLRAQLWPLLPSPSVAPLSRPAAAAAGQRYLRALEGAQP